MRLLFILTELPYPASRNGIALINFELLRRAPTGIVIDLLITDLHGNNEDIEKLRIEAPAINRIDFTGEPLSRKYRVGNLLSGILLGRNLFTQPGIRRHLDNLEQTPDAFYVSPMMAGVDFKQLSPLFLNAVDSFARLNENAFLRSGRWRDLLKKHLYRAYERRTLRDASMVNFVSSADLEYVRTGAPSLPLINISNGVDNSIFKPNEPQRIPGRLLFTGNFDYAPNAEAARHLVCNIFPKILAAWPSATLQVVGRNPPADVIGHKNVFATGFVADISASYRSAQVFVCPLLSGAGVKNKVLEALSSGLPVVTTALGVEGIEHLEADRHYLLADDDETMARCVVATLRDEELRASLGENARTVVTRYHGWAPIVSRYFDALDQVARKPERRAS